MMQGGNEVKKDQGHLEGLGKSERFWRQFPRRLAKRTNAWSFLIRKTNTTPHCFCKCAQRYENKGDAAFSDKVVCAKCAQPVEIKGDTFSSL